MADSLPKFRHFPVDCQESFRFGGLRHGLTIQAHRSVLAEGNGRVQFVRGLLPSAFFPADNPKAIKSIVDDLPSPDPMSSISGSVETAGRVA